MPTVQHDAAMYLMRCRAELAPALLAYLAGVDIPHEAVALWSGSDLSKPLSDNKEEIPKSATYLPDAVVSMLDQSLDHTMTILVETQRRNDAVKRYTWPEYLAHARLIHRVPAHLLVFATNPSTAKWSSEEIGIGHKGFSLIPHVVHAENLPDPADPEWREFRAELTVLAVVLGRFDLRDGELCARIANVLDRIPERFNAETYFEIISQSITGDALKTWKATVEDEDLLPPTSPLVESFKDRGRLDEARRMFFMILDRRNFEISDELRERVSACKEIRLIEVWADLALTDRTVERISASIASVA